MQDLSIEKKRKSRFENVAVTQSEEDSFDIAAHRKVSKPCGVTASVANIVKGALGAGILSGHVGYMKAGCWIALFASVFIGLYLTYCLHLLVKSAQTLYKRTNVATMTYPDVGEAAFACSSSPCLRKWAKPFRYSIDIVVCINLFGSCACYQIIIAKSIKQLVENTLETDMEPQIEGYPNLRVYMAVMIVPCIVICLLRYLQWLAPFSLIANGFIGLCIILTIYYAFENNPKFENLVAVKDASGFFGFCGVAVFSMSCVGVCLPVENNMKEPSKFTKTLIIGMAVIILAAISTSFFGYAAFLERSESPITVNFPMTLFPKILRCCIILMIYVTHALNFFVPFDLTFYYLKNLHSPKRIVMWELIYRAVFVVVIGLFAIAFPSIEALSGFLGTFCISNMAFIWPNLIDLVVVWERPGLGRWNWRLWKSLALILVGVSFFVAGTYVNAADLFKSALHATL
ncbi:hypothetical protein O0L34_g2666 [Tuta absoluta]|nr:hypothetical protein O0L34_g2666 [Tuta absoluta]